MPIEFYFMTLDRTTYHYRGIGLKAYIGVRSTEVDPGLKNHFRFEEIFCISTNGGKLPSSSTFSFLSYFLAAALMSCVFKPNVVSLVKIIRISSYVPTVVAEIKVTPSFEQIGKLRSSLMSIYFHP